MSKEEWFPVFQMRLALGPSDQTGWVLADEDDSEEFSAPSFTIAEPERDAAGYRYGFPGEIEGKPWLFFSKYDGKQLVFEHQGMSVRWGLGDRFSAGISRAYSYFGQAGTVIGHYGKTGYTFVSLVPLDLIAMDRLYLDYKVAFIGVTKSFGPHVTGLVFPGVP
jgi:hypothetical protein